MMTNLPEVTDSPENVTDKGINFPKNIPAYWINIAIDRQSNMPVKEIAKKYNISVNWARQIIKYPEFLQIERSMAENLAANWVIDARAHLKTMLPQALANYEQELANPDKDINERRLRLIASKDVIEKNIESQPPVSEHKHLHLHMKNIDMGPSELRDKILRIGNE